MEDFRQTNGAGVCAYDGRDGGDGDGGDDDVVRGFSHSTNSCRHCISREAAEQSMKSWPGADVTKY